MKIAEAEEEEMKRKEIQTAKQVCKFYGTTVNTLY